MVTQVVFWFCVGTIGFTYVGYPLVLYVLVLLRRRKPLPEMTDWPKISILVVAFNEENRICNKIHNLLESDYPKDRLEIIICSDGSTDNTNRLVEQYTDPRVRLVALPTNIGINEAFSMGAAQASGELLLLTDSYTRFEKDTIKIATRHFADPKVGLVSGRIVFTNPLKSAVGSGYRRYWEIETNVRFLESRLGVVVVVVGSHEMVRKELYLPVPSQFTRDMASPIYVHSKGFLCQYEPDAVHSTPQEKTPKQDFSRRSRMALRAWGSVPYLLKTVPFFKNIGSWSALICHKYLRWVSWVFMIGMFISSLFLLDGLFYQIAFWIQVAAYGMAMGGWVLAAMNVRVWLFSLVFYFCLLQAAALIGLTQALRGRRVATWKPVK